VGGLQRFCVACGYEMRPGQRFCTVCGRAAKEDSPVPAGQRPGGLAAPEPPDAPRRGRSRWPLLVGLVVLVAAGAAAAVVVLHPFHHTLVAGGAARASQHSGRPSPSAPDVPSVAATGTPLATARPTSSAPLSPQQAAQGLAMLLARSVADRSSVVNAVAGVANCGPGLHQDPRIFRAAAASRQRLLAELAGLPGRSALPAPLLQALTTAWQASATADGDFARWAQDERSRGCVPGDHADPGYQAATGPDNRATAAKKAFAGRWDLIARQYGLHPYRWNQL
jgi:hypothetical protein